MPSSPFVPDSDFDPVYVPPASAASCGSSDLMATGMAWLTSQLQAKVSQAVTYSRGTDSVDLCVTYGRKRYKLDDGDGFRIEYTDRDFLVPAASLILAGVETLPERGDIVRCVEGNTAQFYQVLAPGGEPEWEWSDPFRSMLRIHAKHIGPGE